MQNIVEFDAKCSCSRVQRQDVTRRPRYRNDRREETVISVPWAHAAVIAMEYSFMRNEEFSAKLCRVQLTACRRSPGKTRPEYVSRTAHRLPMDSVSVCEPSSMKMVFITCRRPPAFRNSFWSASCRGSARRNSRCEEGMFGSVWCARSGPRKRN